jgi:hypothetical protein
MEELFGRRVHLFLHSKVSEALGRQPPITANGAWNSLGINELDGYPQAVREICSRLVQKVNSE